MIQNKAAVLFEPRETVKNKQIIQTGELNKFALKTTVCDGTCYLTKGLHWEFPFDVLSMPLLLKYNSGVLSLISPELVNSFIPWVLKHVLLKRAGSLT